MLCNSINLPYMVKIDIKTLESITRTGRTLWPTCLLSLRSTAIDFLKFSPIGGLSSTFQDGSKPMTGEELLYPATTVCQDTMVCCVSLISTLYWLHRHFRVRVKSFVATSQNVWGPENHGGWMIAILFIPYIMRF
jgi:hypothetical protein